MALFDFPDPVDEVSARLVAGGVVVMASTALALGQPWLTGPLAYGFVARVLTGPTLSPLGQLVTRAIRPRLALAPKPVPGPPKRFAQAIGAVVTGAAAIAHFGFGLTAVANALLGAIVAAASLEAGFAFCIGCRIFGVLMARGLVPADVCERCANVGAAPPAALRTPR